MVLKTSFLITSLNFNRATSALQYRKTTAGLFRISQIINKENLIHDVLMNNDK